MRFLKDALLVGLGLLVVPVLMVVCTIGTAIVMLGDRRAGRPPRHQQG